jgi:hypothetical protein
MLFSTEFRDQLRTLEREAAECRDLLKKIRSRNLRLLGEMDGLRLQMGWREKYFRGWFGGNKLLVQESRRLNAELKDTLVGQEAQKVAIETAERVCIEAVAAHLAENDPEFRDLDQRRAAAGKVKAAADELLEAIDHALGEVDDAQGTETLDLVSKDKGISILSHLENDEANEAIGEVKDAAQRFRAALESYNGGIKEKLSQETGVERINDDIDLVLDLVGDGFDFMSLFTLSQLNDAEEALNEFRGKCAGLISEVNTRYSSLCDRCDQRITEARRRRA